VEHHVDAVDGGLRDGRVLQVALEELDRGAVEPRVRPVAGREVVDHAHAQAAGDEVADDVGADEAGPAGDEEHEVVCGWRWWTGDSV
jgi:hypothetical protein